MQLALRQLCVEKYEVFGRLDLLVQYAIKVSDCKIDCKLGLFESLTELVQEVDVSSTDCDKAPLDRSWHGN